MCRLLSDHERGSLLVDAAVVEHQPGEAHGIGAIVVGAFFRGVTLGDVTAYGIGMPGDQQITLAKVKGDVDAVARLEREKTHDPCRDGDATITAKGDVGAACALQ